MPEITANFSNVAGTEAALGWAGAHTIVADRPAGVAGGEGLGFNGGQLLALALGGCFCNDLRYAAEQMGRALGDINVAVKLKLEGDPLLVTRAQLSVRLTAADGADPGEIFEIAKTNCTVGNSVRRGFPVEIESERADD